MGATNSTSKNVDDKWLSISAQEVFNDEFIKTEILKLPPSEKSSSSAKIPTLVLSSNPKIDPKELSDLYLSSETHEPLMSDIISIFRGIYSESQGNITTEPSWLKRKRVMHVIEVNTFIIFILYLIKRKIIDVVQNKLK